MRQKLKPKKCRRAKCRKEFQPKTKWQDFCCVACRSAVAYRRNADLLKRAEKLLEAQGAAPHRFATQRNATQRKEFV